MPMLAGMYTVIDGSPITSSSTSILSQDLPALVSGVLRVPFWMRHTSQLLVDAMVTVASTSPGIRQSVGYLYSSGWATRGCVMDAVPQSSVGIKFFEQITDAKPGSVFKANKDEEHVYNPLMPSHIVHSVIVERVFNSNAKPMLVTSK